MTRPTNLPETLIFGEHGRCFYQIIEWGVPKSGEWVFVEGKEHAHIKLTETTEFYLVVNPWRYAVRHVGWKPGDLLK